MLKAKDLRDVVIEELEAQLQDIKAELFELVNEIKKSKKLDKPHLIREKKKNIAKLITVIKEKRTQTL